MKTHIHLCTLIKQVPLNDHNNRDGKYICICHIWHFYDRRACVVMVRIFDERIEQTNRQEVDVVDNRPKDDAIHQVVVLVKLERFD